MKPFPEKDNVTSVKWNSPEPPGRILVIRLHAIGDAALTLPACSSLRNHFPNAQIDYLTTGSVKGLISAFDMFDHLYVLERGFEIIETGYGSAAKKLARLTEASQMGLELRKNNYDAVIDLQNSKYSKIVRRLSGTKFFSEFDRYEAKAHSLRVIETIHRAGFDSIENKFDLHAFENIVASGKKLLIENGWDGKKKIVVLNPAGAFETRKWGDENYSALGKLLVNAGHMLLILGTDKLEKSVETLKSHLKENIIDLSGKTTLEEVPGVLTHTAGIVSDDSGLYHIAWALGKPGILLLGSTRSARACQPGSHSICLNSSDLECGNCMLERCKWGDVRCLNRYSAEMVYEKLGKVMRK